MVYMGSKRQYCKYIVPIIQKYINENHITAFIGKRSQENNRNR